VSVPGDYFRGTMSNIGVAGAKLEDELGVDQTARN
jgi:hypothetical protein